MSDEPVWTHTHARVRVVGARGLRAKGRHSGALAVLELGGERFYTGAAAAAAAAGGPEWREEVTLPLPPSRCNPGDPLLRITVLQRSLIGSDAFLGQLALPLTHLYLSRDAGERWYKLSSKPGKKEKERGEIQLSVQFVRNSLTASMFDLSSKEKHRSPLAKLRDKVKGKKRQEWPAGDSASAIVPSSVGQLTSDDDLSDKGVPEKRSKKGFFSRHKLHRSSLTKSNTSLGSQHSLRSTESADSNVAAAGLPSPTTPTSPGLVYPPTPVPSTNPSLAKLLTHKRALSDEVNQVLEIHPSHMALKTSTISRSLLCINGSHVYREDSSTKPASGFPPAPAPPCHGHHHAGGKAEAPGASAEGGQRLASGAHEPEVRVVPPVIAVSAGEGARASAGGQKTQTETAGGGQGAKPVHAAVPILSTADPPRAQPPPEDKKDGNSPFGSDPETQRPRTPSPVRTSSSLAERSKASGWFLKDNTHKPSLEVSPAVETSSDSPSPTPCLPLHPPPAPLLPPAPPLPPHPDCPSDTTNTNPFTAAERVPGPPPKPATNPFFSALQSNPFFEDLVADETLKTPPFTPSLSSLPLGSHGASEDPAPTPSAAGKDRTGLGKAAAEEATPPGLPASTEATSRGPRSFQGPDASAETGPSAATRSSALHSPGPAAASGGNLETPSPWAPASAVPAGHSTHQVPSPALGDREVECPEGGGNFSWSAQVGGSPPVEPAQARTKASSSLMRSTEPRAQGNESPDVVWAVPSTNDASGVDFGIQPAPVMDNVSLDESVDLQSVSSTDDGLGVKTGRASANRHGVEMAGGPTGRDLRRSLVPTEDSGSAADGVGDGFPGAARPSSPGPEPRVTDAGGGVASPAPVFAQSGESESIRGDARPDAPPPVVSPSSLPRRAAARSCESGLNVRLGDGWRGMAALGEAVPEGPETSGGEEGKLTGPPPPTKPPRLLASSHQAVGEAAGVAEEQALDHPSSAVQPREGQRGDQGLERKVSLVVTGPPTEIHPQQPGSPSAPSATEEPFGMPSYEASKEKSSCGTFEFSLNEKTGMEHYRTCLSNLSIEAMTTLRGGDETANRLGHFQSTGPVEVHQLVEVQTATLVTTAARVKPLETVSLVEDLSPTVLEGRAVFSESSQSEQSEQDFVLAVEELPHKSSPVFPEPGVTVASGGGGEPGEERRGERSARMGNGGRGGQGGGSAELKAGLGTSLSGEPARAGMDVERREAGEQRASGRLGGGQVPSLELQGSGDCPGSEQRDGGEDVDGEEGSPLENQEDSTREQQVVGEDFVSEQREAGKNPSSEQRRGRKSCGSEQRVMGEGSASTHRGMGQDLALEQRDGGKYATVEKRDGGEGPSLDQRDSGAISPLEQQDGGERSDLPENPPSGTSSPLARTRRVLGKVDPNPHRGHPTVRDARLQALGVGEPAPGEGSSAAPVDPSLEEGLSFKELHQKAAPPAGEPAARRHTPLAFSTPHPAAATNAGAPDLPSPILPVSSGAAAPPPGPTRTAAGSQRSPRPAASRGPPLTVSPLETQPAEASFPQQRTSPHPVKPITAAALGVTEKRSARSHLSNTLTSGLEKLKSVTTGHISPMRSPVSGPEEQEAVKECKPADPLLHYYHLTHDELIKKILQQESQIQKTEEHVRDLEEYIDLLLVHIMEQNPSILQTVSEKVKAKTATK